MSLKIHSWNPKQQFFDGWEWWFSIIFWCKYLVHHPIETTIGNKCCLVYQRLESNKKTTPPSFGFPKTKWWTKGGLPLQWLKSRWHSPHQVIQFVTFLSTFVGSHDSPLKGSRFRSPSQKDHKLAELPGTYFFIWTLYSTACWHLGHLFWPSGNF